MKTALCRVVPLVIVLCFAHALNARADATIVETDGGKYTMYEDSKALIIGASNYVRDDFPDLKMVPPEVELISKALKEQGFEVQLVMDPTTDEMLESVRKFLLRSSKKNSRRLVYFAGHGDTKEYQPYLVPVDAADPADTDGEYIPSLMGISEIINIGRSARSKHVMFVFDSCFSGGILMVRRNFAAKASLSYLIDMDRVVRQYITAGTIDEAVPDSLDFAKAFVDGIQGKADRNNDGIVAGSELGYYIKDEIIPGNQQTPQYAVDTVRDFRDGDMIFVVPNKASKLQYKADVSGPRNAVIRNLGDPKSEKQKVYASIEILYYRTKADGYSIISALDDQRIPYSTTLADDEALQLRTNTIACGPDIPIDALKQLTKELLKRDVPIKQIVPFARPEEKIRRIEILVARDDSLNAQPNLTPEQVDSLTACPQTESGRASW